MGEGESGRVWHTWAAPGSSWHVSGGWLRPFQAGQGMGRGLLSPLPPRVTSQCLQQGGIFQRDPKSPGAGRGWCCINTAGFKLEVGFSSSGGDQAVQVWAEKARNTLQHTGVAPLSLPAALGPHLLDSTSHGQPLSCSHVSRANVCQVHEVHGLPDHGAVDPSPPLLGLGLLHHAAAQLVPEVAHAGGGGSSHCPPVLAQLPGPGAGSLHGDTWAGWHSEDRSSWLSLRGSGSRCPVRSPTRGSEVQVPVPVPVSGSQRPQAWP